MFPPKKTTQAKVWIEGLLASLQRAETGFTGNWRAEEQEKNLQVRLELPQRLTATMEKSLRAYVLAYANASGWRIQRFHVLRDGVAFEASTVAAPARSSR